MKKKKILVITPVTPSFSSVEALISSLDFLKEEYQIDPMDSFCFDEGQSNADFYQAWEKKIEACLPDYDAFFGFSFGGVILQQCFHLFAETNKALVLFSTPSFTNSTLARILRKAIQLCQNDRLAEAILFKDHYVYYPNSLPAPLNLESLNQALASRRMIFGLRRALTTDSTKILNTLPVKHLHLIGERSLLVNQKNVIKAINGTLVIVPDAGMRVLRDAPAFCRQLILNNLMTHPPFSD